MTRVIALVTALLLAPKPLDRPFTLVYKATFADMRTKAEKDTAYAVAKAALDARVDADALSAEAEATALADLRKTLDAPPVVETLTLSYDGHTLLIDESPQGPGEANVVLLGPNGDYRFAPGQKDAVRGQFSSTVPYEALGCVPLVGAVLPLLPFMDGNRVLDLPASAVAGSPTYAPATLSQDPRGAVTKIAFRNGSSLTLSAHVPLNGVLAARWIVRTRPGERADYSLLSFLPTSVPNERFRPDHYVADGDEFAVQGRGGFVVDSRKGDLAAQIAAFTKSSP